MILLALLAVVLVVLVLAVAAPPRAVVREAARDVVATVRRGVPYAYQYVLKGPGGRDEGDHDCDKLVVRAERRWVLIVVWVAPVDRAGRRTGRSRLLLLVK